MQAFGIGLHQHIFFLLESKYPSLELFGCGISLLVCIWFQIKCTFYECWVLFSNWSLWTVSSVLLVDVIATSVRFNSTSLSITANHSSIEININFDNPNFMFFEVLCKINPRKGCSPMADGWCYSISHRWRNNSELIECPLKHNEYFLQLKKKHFNTENAWRLSGMESEIRIRKFE